MDDEHAAAAAPTTAGEPGPDGRVLRSFVRDGRLVAIPAQHAKRLVILRWLLETRFADEGPWPERDVNMRLALVHRDVAALRRYLVDAGLMARPGGIYRKVAPPAQPTTWAELPPPADPTPPAPRPQPTPPADPTPLPEPMTPSVGPDDPG